MVWKKGVSCAGIIPQAYQRSCVLTHFRVSSVNKEKGIDKTETRLRAVNSVSWMPEVEFLIRDTYIKSKIGVICFPTTKLITPFTVNRLLTISTQDGTPRFSEQTIGCTADMHFYRVCARRPCWRTKTIEYICIKIEYISQRKIIVLFRSSNMAVVHTLYSLIQFHTIVHDLLIYKPVAVFCSSYV